MLASNFRRSLGRAVFLAAHWPVKGSALHPPVQPARRLKEKPTIILAAPELSHRLMSGPAPLVGGSAEVLLKQRGPGLHVTVFKFTSEQRPETKERSCLSWEGNKIGADTHKGRKTPVWFSGGRGYPSDYVWSAFGSHPSARTHACEPTCSHVDSKLMLDQELDLEYGRGLAFSLPLDVAGVW